MKWRQQMSERWRKYGRTYLPYVGIVAILISMGAGWQWRHGNTQGAVTETATTETEEKPAEGAEAAETVRKEPGTCVCSTLAAVRPQAVKDLFAPVSLPPVQENTPPTGSADATEGVPTGSGRVEEFPKVCGFIQAGQQSIVLLREGDKTRACQVGDTIGPYVVVYIRGRCIGLGRDNMVKEVTG